jgi:glycosyltransferase involved in cell wall biosynthesis
MENKKIVFCINSMDKGGAERVISILANYFSKKNEIYIITITDNKIEYKLEESINLIKLVNKKNKINNKLIRKISILPKFLVRTIKLRKILIQISADVIISFLPEASFMSLLANNGRTKIIVSDRNDPKIEYKNPIYNYFMKKLYPKADGYVFQTLDAKKYFNNLLALNDINNRIIYNPVDDNFICDRFEGIRKKNIVSVGRLTEQKNYDLLIDAFYDISNIYQDYNLIIYGEGPLRQNYQNKIKQLGLENRIFLPGLTDNIKNKIYDSSVFVMTSKYEGMPNSLIEAMCLGLPVISSDCPCGGPKMLISNGKNGFLYNVNDKDELVYNLKKILDNQKLSKSLGENASKLKYKVNSSNIIEEWEKFIVGIERSKEDE